MHKQSHPPAHYLTLKCTVLCDPELPILWSSEIDVASAIVAVWPWFGHES